MGCLVMFVVMLSYLDGLQCSSELLLSISFASLLFLDRVELLCFALESPFTSILQPLHLRPLFSVPSEPLVGALVLASSFLPSSACRTSFGGRLMVTGVFPAWDDRVVAVIATDDDAGC